MGQVTVFWDTNGSTAGSSSSTTAAGTWSSSSNSNWSTNSAGTSSTTSWSASASGGKVATFAAGTNATGTYTVSVSGKVSDVAGMVFQEGNVAVGGSGTLALTGSSVDIAVDSTSATVSAILSGTSEIQKLGTGRLILSGNNTFSGGTTLTSGTLGLGHDRALGTGALTVNGGTITAVNAERTITNDVIVGGNFTVGGSQALTFNGSVNLGGASPTITIDNTALTTFAGSVIEPWWSGFTKAGSGELVLAGANSFSAPVAVTGGTLTLANSAALGASGTYGNSVGPNATLKLQGGVTIAEHFTIVGTGASGAGAIRNASGDNTLSGSVTLAGSASITSASGSLGITGQIQIEPSSTLTTSGAGNITVSSPIFGNTLTHTGSGTLAITGTTANSFTTLNITDGTVALGKTNGTHAVDAGTINIGDGSGSSGTATLRLESSNQIADYAGTLNLRSDGLFDVNNFSEPVNTIGGTGTIDLGTSGELTVGVHSGSSTFGGSIEGEGTFIKTGSGVLEFTDDLQFDGTFVLAAGSLKLGDITLKLATLSVTGSSTIDLSADGSRLEIDQLLLAANTTLTILNWDEDDRLLVDSWLGAAYNTSGSAPMNQIVFSGYNSNSTRWNSYDDSITPHAVPVPEPSTYGATFIALLVGFFVYRRRPRR